MKRLPQLLLLLLLAISCKGPRVIDESYPWPTSGVSEADTLMLAFERARTTIGISDSAKHQIARQLSAIAEAHPENELLQMRKVYVEVCTLLSKNPTKGYMVLEEGMKGFDSLRYPYDWHALQALKLPGERSLFRKYQLASDNVTFFEKNGGGVELARNLMLKGNVLCDLGDTARALDCYDRAEEIFRKNKFPQGVYFVEVNRLPLRTFEENKETLSRMLTDTAVQKAPTLYVPLLQTSYYFTDSVAHLDTAINIVRRERVNERDLPVLLAMKAADLVYSGNPEQALEMVGEIRRVEQEQNPVTRYRPAIHHDLAVVFEANGMLDSTISELEQTAYWTDSLQREYNYKGVYSTETKLHIESAEQNAMLKRKQLILWWVLSVITVGAVSAVIYLKLKKDAQKREAELRLLDEKIENEQRMNFAQSSVLEESDRLLAQIDEAVDRLSEQQQITSDGREELRRIASNYRSNEENRQGFLKINREVDNEFSKRLKKDFPDLAESQLRLAALIAAGVDSHQLSVILNISPKSIYTSRYRLRTRLGLSKTDSLEDFLRQYSYRGK